MILRIVRMEFNKDKITDFLKIFNRQKKIIENFPGCKGVKLYRDAVQENVFYTYSIWESVEALENYRSSEVFRKTWKEVKELFSGKPLAYSLKEFYEGGQ